MNATWQLQSSTVGQLCRQYAKVLFQDLEGQQFGDFDGGPSQAVVYDGVRVLLLAVPLAVLAFLSSMDILSYKSPAIRAFFWGLRAVEVITYLLVGILDAILTWTLFGIGEQSATNLVTWYWLTMNIVLILNSIATILYMDVQPRTGSATLTEHQHRHGSWMLACIDANWIVFGILLVLQFEGTQTSAILRIVAGLLFVLSTALFSTASRRYDTIDAQKSCQARFATSCYYALQFIGALLVCLSYSTAESAPIQLVVATVPGSPYKVFVICLWVLAAVEAIVLALGRALCMTRTPEFGYSKLGRGATGIDEYGLTSA